MFEAIINVPLTTVVRNPGAGNLTDAVVYKDGDQSAQPVTVSRIGSSAVWKVTFTPNSTGSWALHAFGTIQYRTKCVPKSIYDYAKNLEDEAMGSWQWDKETNVLTMLRQDGTVLATFNMQDGLSVSSRERI